MRVGTVALVMALGALSGCAAVGPATSTEPESSDVSGKLVWSFPGLNNPCFAAPITEGVTDLQPGATVTIRDAGGETVALGELGDFTHDSYGECTFSWSATDVPMESDFYSVEVAGRGETNVTREELISGVTLTTSR